LNNVNETKRNLDTATERERKRERERGRESKRRRRREKERERDVHTYTESKRERKGEGLQTLRERMTLSDSRIAGHSPRSAWVAASMLHDHININPMHIRTSILFDFFG